MTAAIVLWNTVYLERATSALRGNGTALDDTLLQYLSPLGWEHINLTGDYLCAAAPRSVRGSLGHCDRCHRLSVLYFPFSETTPISCPSCSATDGVVRNGKSTAGHQRYLCSHCRKTWQLQFTYTASQPGTHQKIIDMAMNGVGCRATARIMGVGLNTILRHLKTQAAVGNLAHTAGQ